MKKLLLGLGSVIAMGVLVAPSARAGSKGTFPIQVTSNHAHGQYGNVRASSSSSEFITCWTEAWGGPGEEETAPMITCLARNNSGVQRACVSSDPRFVATAGTVNGDSYVAFDIDTVDFVCTYLQVENGSNLAPKAP